MINFPNFHALLNNGSFDLHHIYKSMINRLISIYLSYHFPIIFPIIFLQDADVILV